MKRLTLWLYREEAGQDLTEYALLLALVALAAVVAMNALGFAINTTYAKSGNALVSR